MILGVAVYFPEVVKLRVGQDIFHAQHRRHHGVVLVIVFVHPVAANEMEIRITLFELLANGADVLGVIVVVNRISFFLANHRAVEHVTGFGQTYLKQLALGQLDQVFILRIPNAVVFEAEILKTVTRFVGVRYHLGRPGTEILDPADFDVRIVDVNPVVVKRIAILYDQHDGEEVAVLQRIGRGPGRFGNSRPNSANQLAHRRRGNNMLRFELLRFPLRIPERNAPGFAGRVVIQAHDFAAHLDFAAHRPGFSRARFPHHARAFARIAERID